MLTPGSRWRSNVCDAEFVVVKSAKQPVSVECGGEPLIPHGSTRSGVSTVSPDHAGGSKMGKRYHDTVTGLELLCSKSGIGSPSVDGRTMPTKEAKKLPSSD